MDLDEITNEYGRWAVQIKTDPDARGLSAGTWRRNVPHAGGISVHAPDASSLREIAGTLDRAADIIDQREAERHASECGVRVQRHPQSDDIGVCAECGFEEGIGVDSSAFEGASDA